MTMGTRADIADMIHFPKFPSYRFNADADLRRNLSARDSVVVANFSFNHCRLSRLVRDFLRDFLRDVLRDFLRDVAFLPRAPSPTFPAMTEEDDCNPVSPDWRAKAFELRSDSPGGYGVVFRKRRDLKG